MEFCRKINLIGDIDEEMYSSFVEALDGMVEIDGDKANIYIELSSHGGDAMIAIALFDRIRLHKGEVTINAFGPVCSAAVLVLAAGDVRIMSKNSVAMFHEDVVAINTDARVSQVETAAKNARLLEIMWDTMLESKTKVSWEKWDEIHSKETYLSADECKKLGLVDKVV